MNYPDTTIYTVKKAFVDDMQVGVSNDEIPKNIPLGVSDYRVPTDLCSF